MDCLNHKSYSCHASLYELPINNLGIHDIKIYLEVMDLLNYYSGEMFEIPWNEGLDVLNLSKAYKKTKNRKTSARTL
jgi:hypothetical protein